MFSLALLVLIPVGSTNTDSHDFLIHLRNDTIQQVTLASTGEWLVMFHSERCRWCRNAFPMVAEYANKSLGNPKVAEINARKYAQVREDFGLVTYPLIIFFSHPKRYVYQSTNRTVPALEAFVAECRNKKQKDIDTMKTKRKSQTNEFKSLFRTHRFSAIIVIIVSFCIGVILSLSLVAIYQHCMKPAGTLKARLDDCSS